MQKGQVWNIILVNDKYLCIRIYASLLQLELYIA